MSTSVYCPFCHKHTAPKMAQASFIYLNIPGHTDASWQENEFNKWWIGICNFCRRPMLIRNYGDTVYPQPLPSPTNPNVPKDIAGDLDEAKMCLAVKCYRAAATMARRCIQSACLQRGAPDDDPYRQIKHLLEKQIITKDMSDWANAVRCLGRDGAHPNKGFIGKTDAEDAVSLAEKFLEVLFVVPKIANAQRERREIKKPKKELPKEDVPPR